MFTQSRRHFLRSLLVLSALLALASPVTPTRADKPAVRGPTVIYIIRHGEKPQPNASHPDPNLAPKGVERANALAHVFPKNFVVPDFIWATAASKHSNRPYETVQPLAKALNMKILNQYANADFAKLANDLLTQPQYSGKTVLISWHHENIPALAKALGAINAPDKWKNEVFDRVWVLTYVAGKVQFQDLPEKALPGDSDK